MEVFIRSQLLTTLFSVILGLFLGIIYDSLKTIRMIFGIKVSEKILIREEKIGVRRKTEKKKSPLNSIFNSILLAFWDVLYFVIITPIMQIFIYATSNGIVRWYIIFGTILGFVLYRHTLGRIISSIFEYIVILIRVLLYYVKKPLIKLVCALKCKIKNAKLKKDKKKSFRIQKRKKLLSFGRQK